MIICNNLFNIQYIYLKFCNYGNIMAINMGVDNWIQVPNIDTYNFRCRNNCSITQSKEHI